MGETTPKHMSPESKARKHPIVFIIIGIVVVAGLVVGEYFARPYISQYMQKVQNAQGGTSTSASAQTNEPSADASSDQSTQATAEEEAKKAAEEEAAKKPAEPVVIEAMMIGDILMHDNCVQSGLQEDGSYNYDFLYQRIKPYMDVCDVKILNQETVMGLPENGYSMTNGGMGPIMNSPTALADSEMRFGFNMILNAHNHIFDQGYEGLGHEMDYWKAHYPAVPILGVNNPNAAAGDGSQDYVNNVYVFEKQGFKIAFLNHTYDTNEHPNPDEDAKFCSYLTEDKIRADVQKARDLGVDLIVACPHWGEQYTTITSEEENTFSKLYTELGVDLIFGCHPHIVQRVEMLRNAQGHKTVCYYSLGNYVASLMSAECLIGSVARATFVKEADGTAHVTNAQLVPTVICNTVGPDMTSFPILDYTWEVAARSSSGGELTPDFAQSFCIETLGDGYDPANGVFTLNMADEGRLV